MRGPASRALIVALWPLAAFSAPTREVGEDYQVDYQRSPGMSVQVQAPTGSTVEIRQGVQTVARGPAPLALRPQVAGELVVTIKARNGARWETHVEARARSRVVLQAWPGRVRTRVTVTPADDAVAQPMRDAAFLDLASTLGAAAANHRLATLTGRAGDARFTAVQGGELMDLFERPADRIRVLGWLKPRLVDPDNAIGLSGRFTLVADRRRAEKLLR